MASFPSSWKADALHPAHGDVDPAAQPVFRRTPKAFNGACRFVGGTLLEAYLIHDHFVMTYIERLHLGYWPTFLITIAITLPVAWALHTILARMTKPIEKRIQ